MLGLVGWHVWLRLIGIATAVVALFIGAIGFYYVARWYVERK